VAGQAVLHPARSRIIQPAIEAVGRVPRPSIDQARRNGPRIRALCNDRRNRPAAFGLQRHAVLIRERQQLAIERVVADLRAAGSGSDGLVVTITCSTLAGRAGSLAAFLPACSASLSIQLVNGNASGSCRRTRHTRHTFPRCGAPRHRSHQANLAQAPAANQTSESRAIACSRSTNGDSKLTGWSMPESLRSLEGGEAASLRERHPQGWPAAGV
jgi:hypothetical protein